MNEMKKNSPVIEISSLRKSYGSHDVLKGFDLTLREGENVVVMGKSGCGKSVMIKCIVGLEAYDGGTIKVWGREVGSLSGDELDDLRTEIGFLFQGSALYDSMTVRENLEFPLRRHTKKFGRLRDTLPMVTEALANVGLVNAISLMPEELSGGMKRRIALARTLILQPKIILYDEPTTGLDPITSKEIVSLMKTVQQKYRTSSIIITHDVDCARVIADRMILLVDGINYAEGTFAHLSVSGDPVIRAFFK